MEYEDPYYKDNVKVVKTPDGKVVLSSTPKAISDYFQYLYMMMGEKDVHKKLGYCHEQLKLLPFFIKYLSKIEAEAKAEYSEDSLERDDSPEEYACCYWGPELYRRIGEWNKAREFIQECIKAGAYYPDRGEEELAYHDRYVATATAAISYIQDNPGVLQKDIYKLVTGADVNRDVLKNFMRCSLLIRKEPFKNTNKVYLADKIL